MALVGVAEIAEMLGVSRARVTQLAQTYEDFPEPEAELAAGRIWSRTAIESWIRDHPSRPGGRRAATDERSTSFFDRFDDAARESIVLAQEQARLFGHAHIGCEHLLLGLAHEQTGVAGRVLHSVGADPATLTDALQAVAPARPHKTSGHLPFTPRAKRALEASYRESLERDSDVVSTEDILLGMLGTDGVNLAIRLLRDDVGITPKQLRSAILDARPNEAVRPAASVGLDDVLARLDHVATMMDKRLSAVEKRLADLTERQ